MCTTYKLLVQRNILAICFLLLKATEGGKSTWRTLRSHFKNRPSLVGRLKSNPEETFGYAHVDYGSNHPFQRHSRRLEDVLYHEQETLTYNITNNNNNNAEYDIIRIKFLLDPILSQRGQSSLKDEKIQNILNQVIPRVQRTWMTHLSVVPVQSPIPIQMDACFGAFRDDIPDSMIQNGVDNADLAIFVQASNFISIENEEFDTCPPGVLAVATSCVLDQFDRPIVGFINFCLDELTRRMLQDDKVFPTDEIPPLDVLLTERLEVNSAVVEEGTLADTALVAIHEVAHVLGVDSSLFLYFRDPDTGEPLTKRPFQQKEVECIDGETVATYIPDSNTVVPTISSTGTLYYDVVTPRVRTVVRNHFNCQSLPGARLENQDTGGTCIGAHFDERIFYSELMGPIFSATTDILSPLTLALFEDSGWYKVYYDGAQVSPFGHGAGCDFVNEDCIINDQVPDYATGAFCTSVARFSSSGLLRPDQNDLFCDPTHRAIGICDLFERSDLEELLPSYVLGESLTYFSDSSLLSATAQVDWCPVASVPVVDCTEPRANTNSLGFSGTQLPLTYVGETHGENSRCINFEPSALGRTVAGCFTTECDAENRQVIVNGQVCEFDGQRLAVEMNVGFSVNMICPKLAVVCPDMFCQAGCSARGICNFNTNECECFDSDDTTAICSASIGDRENFTLAPTPVPPPSNAYAVSSSMTATMALILNCLVVLVLYSKLMEQNKAEA